MDRIFAGLNIKNKAEFSRFIRQFIKFCFVGAANTIIYLGIYYLLLFFKVNYIMANTVGFLFSVLNAYYWNHKLVFETSETDSRKKFKSFIKVIMAYGVTTLLSTLLLFLWVDMVGISEKIAPVVNLFITIPLNFLLNKYWAMK